MQRKRRQGELHVTLAAWKQEEKLRQRERSKSPERPKSADSSKNLYTHTYLQKIDCCLSYGHCLFWSNVLLSLLYFDLMKSMLLSLYCTNDNRTCSSFFPI